VTGGELLLELLLGALRDLAEPQAELAEGSGLAQSSIPVELAAGEKTLFAGLCER
jgi:hypothetical protein